MSEASATSITERAPRTAAGIAAFRDHDAVRAALQAAFGIAAPCTSAFVKSGPVVLSCLAPTRYFVTAPRETNLLASLAKHVTGLAAITDQSDLWTGFTLVGSGVREKLARIVPIDLTPSKLPVGALVLTRAGHLDVRLWRLGDQNYELLVSRSYADDLRYTLGLGA
jgi:sarcosine oxidase subunit gamma